MTKRNIKIIFFSILALVIAVVGIKLYIKPFTKNPILSFSSYTYKDSSKYTQASYGNVNDVSSFNINWVSGNVEVIPYSGSTIEFEEMSDKPIPENERMCFMKDGNTLRIQFTKSGLHKMVNPEKKLCIYIPENLKIDEFYVDLVSADLCVQEINASVLTVETVSGNVSVNNVSAQKFSYEGVSGTLVADNVSFISFDGEAVSGDVALNILPIYKTENIDIETVSGDIKLAIPNGFGFTLDLDTVSGDISSNINGYLISKNKIKHGDGQLIIELETVSGDVELN